MASARIDDANTRSELNRRFDSQYENEWKERINGWKSSMVPLEGREAGDVELNIDARNMNDPLLLGCWKREKFSSQLGMGFPLYLLRNSKENTLFQMELMIALTFDDVWLKKLFFDNIVAGCKFCVGAKRNRLGRPPIKGLHGQACHQCQ